MNDFVGNIGADVSLYVVIKETNRFYKTFVYTMTSDESNILVWETEKEIVAADGKHYFLVEGKVKQHNEYRREKQTVLSDCDWELVGKTTAISGAFYGSIGDKIEFNNITAKFRKVHDIEWISNGELTIVAPVSEYRLFFDYENHAFMCPFDSIKKLTYRDKGRFNIDAQIIGYRIERGVKTTFICPIIIEDKNGAFYASPPRTYGVR